MTEQPTSQTRMEYGQWRKTTWTQFTKLKQFLDRDTYLELANEFKAILTDIDNKVEELISIEETEQFPTGEE